MRENKGKYEELFITESREMIQKMENLFIELEQKGENKNIIDEIFRLAHTLKGMSASVGKWQIEKISHHIEDELDAIRKGRKKITKIDKFLQKIDEIKKELFEDKAKKKISASGKYIFDVYIQPDTPLKGARAFVILQEVQRMGKVIETSPHVDALKQGNFENSFEIIVETDREAEKIKESINNIPDVEYVFIKRGKEEKPGIEEVEKEIPEIRIKAEKLDKIMNFLGELVIAKDRLNKIVAEYEDKELKDATDSMLRLLSFLQDEIMDLRLIPAAHILEMFPRYLRDKAQELKKEVDVIIEGKEIELDRALLESIKEPLVHILRNSLDHGIETPEERRILGKPEKGKIQISIEREKEMIYVRIKDDGRGIQKDKVIKKALELGLIEEREISFLTEKDIYSFLFHPEFSTKIGITTLSGRGVGLDAVIKFVNKLGGSIEVESAENKGTTFTLRLPLTLAITKSLIIKTDTQRFIIPLTFVQETQDINIREIKRVFNKDFVLLRYELIPVYFIEEKLKLGRRKNGNGKYSLLVIEAEGKKFVLLADAIISQQDVFVKTLDEVLMQIPFITGATILGDGAPALILDPHVLIEE